MTLDPLPADVPHPFMRRPAGGVKARNPLAIIHWSLRFCCQTERRVVSRHMKSRPDLGDRERR
jgi:hypothetical protein